MTTRTLRHFFARQSLFLRPKHAGYKQFYMALFSAHLSADVGTGDATGPFVRPRHTKMTAVVVAKKPTVVAGVEEVATWLSSKGVDIAARISSGKTVEKGAAILAMQGKPSMLLQLERTTVNMLARASGIATSSKRYAERVGAFRFAATRKTVCGFFDKRAATIGGALPHRLGLFDMPMIKDNHRVADPFFLQHKRLVPPFAIEADTTLEALEALEAVGLIRGRWILLLDHFSPRAIHHIATKARLLSPSVILEASGGVTLSSAPKLLAAGADFVSTGSITQNAPAADLSFEIA